MTVVAGASFTATLIDPGHSGVGVRIEVPVTRAIVGYWRAATLSGSLWSAPQVAPLTPGDYLLVWMDGAPTPTFEIFVPLEVISQEASVASAVDNWPPIDVASVTPSVDDVAQLEKTRLRSEDGTEFETFNQYTMVTDEEVESLINSALNMTLAQIRHEIDPIHYETVKELVRLLTAILIEGSFFRNQNEQASAQVGVWRSLYNTMMTGLQNRIMSDVQDQLSESMEGQVLF